MPIAAGEMPRRITIQRSAPEQDASGQEIAAWSDLSTRWASWRRASARETLAAAELSAEVTDVFVIRWANSVQDVGPKDRLLYRGRIYDIADCIEIGFREGIQITASARSD